MLTWLDHSRSLRREKPSSSVGLSYCDALSLLVGYLHYTYIHVIMLNALPSNHSLTYYPFVFAAYALSPTMFAPESKFRPANYAIAGNRWHLDCFRCNTCNTLLDSDANLLLLGDGSLICNNCTYSCNACGNKIEDLAILTGDQAFCATCFRCRNCKRKIENLRYARTSQGIFCMSCHESLMARRRKKSKAAAQAKAREKEGSPMIKDKSLPALPPNAIPPNAFSNDLVSPDSEAPTELSPRPRPAYPRHDSSRSSSRPPRSPERPVDSAKDSSLVPPATGYRNNRNSSIISGDMTSADADSFFIPVALDPSPAPTPTPRSTSEGLADVSKKARDNKDYFSMSKHGSASEKKTDSQASTPHIAFQEKGRKISSDYESPQSERPARKLSKRNGQPKASPIPGEDRRTSNGKVQTAADEFKLQDAPKSKKLVSTRSNTHSLVDAENSASTMSGSGNPRKEKDLPPALSKSDSPPLLSPPDNVATPQSSPDARFRDDDEVRPSLDSLHSSRSDMPSWRSIARKELPTGASRNGRFPAL